MILAIDPSSSCTGYAMLLSHNNLVEAGRFLPGKTRDSAVHRIMAMGRDLAALIREKQPDEIVIEISSGKVGRRHGGAGAGLAVYGMAVGYLWATAAAFANNDGPIKVHTIEENAWTCGVPKEKRTANVALRFKQYRTADDPGGDVADAIGLGCWWLREAALRQLSMRTLSSTPHH